MSESTISEIFGSGSSSGQISAPAPTLTRRRPPRPRTTPPPPTTPPRTPTSRPRRPPPCPRPPTTTRPRRPFTPCPRTPTRTRTPTLKKNQITIKVKITLGLRKNNIFYSRVEVGVGAPAPATLFRTTLSAKHAKEAVEKVS